MFLRDLSSLSGDSTSVTQIETFGTEVDDLWQRVKKDWDFAVVRNSDYLTWRYLLRPHEHYRAFVKRSDTDIIGLLVMKLYKTGDQTCYAHIMDLIAAADDHNTVADLLAYASQYAENNSAIELSCWLPQEHAHDHVYQQYGFKLDDDLTKWQLILVPPETSIGDDNSPGVFQGISDSGNWHLSMSDSDIY